MQNNHLKLDSTYLHDNHLLVLDAIIVRPQSSFDVLGIHQWVFEDSGNHLWAVDVTFNL